MTKPDTSLVEVSQEKKPIYTVIIKTNDDSLNFEREVNEDEIRRVIRLLLGGWL